MSPEAKGVQLVLVLCALCVTCCIACSGRKVFNNTWGIITDGTGKYPASAQCEWLIIANETGQLISLEHVSMETECSYDYLFVYDGRSYDSPLLGSFSGKTLPDRLLATSGYMLIYFYSDRNYVLNGFYARYSVTACPFNCSSHGACNAATHTCGCDRGYSGAACDVQLCPHACGPHGECDDSVQQCVCDAGYVGYECSLAIDSMDGGNSWYTLSPKGMGFKPRTGHVGVYLDTNNSLYLFGGYTLNDVLDELIMYSFVRNQWKIMEKKAASQWPSARREHAVEQVGANFYIFGGILSDGSHSNDLWFYNVTNNEWSLRAPGSIIQPKGVASHSLTLVDDRWLYLFGGRTENGHFLSDMYKIDVTDDTQWERVIAKGGKTESRRLVGHSCVYHPESSSLIVFGGFLPDNARFPKRTNSLHAYHVRDDYWTELMYQNAGYTEPPKDRAFHSAVVMGNYMVIYGGNTHIHNEEEICYDADVYYYHLTCHRWVDHTALEKAFPGKETVERKGRFSQVAVAAFGNTLLISGGYKGSVLGDLLAYTVPLPIAKNMHDQRFWANQSSCHLLMELDHCKEDPECVWCNSRVQPRCMHKTEAKNCTSPVVRVSRCPGICAALGDCGACTVQGQGGRSVSGATTLPPGLVQQEQCAWCVKEAKCQRLHEPRGVCNSSDSTETGLDGWWDKNSSRLTQLSECRVQDFPAGLHWLRYRYPPDLKHPDEVSIIRRASEQIKFEHYFERENTEKGEYTAKFRGFIHPLGAASSNGMPLQVWLVSVAAQSKLWMSPNDVPEDMEEVAVVDKPSYGNSNATRDGKAIFPYPGRGHRYYMELEARQPIAGRGMTQVVSTMQLEWTGALKDHQKVRQLFYSEFLEPFSSLDGALCDTYDSCLGCMTDTACGWCPDSDECTVRRRGPGSTVGACEGGEGTNMVLVAGECARCDDHVYCDACAGDALCEWLPADARCTRRGRYDDAVRDNAKCPAPCEQHTNCSSCLSIKNECAWCEEHARCFAFVEYVMRYTYGGCTQWIDSLSNQSCHDCQRHRSCDSCLGDFQCGWCGNDDNPTVGKCLHGDFVGPGNKEVCSDVLAEEHNIMSTASWSYGVCPDVEECRLGLHDCHENATCQNTFDAYTCRCNRGFEGDGHNRCDRTCLYDCYHGHCSGAPDFTCLCDIGWTGDECTTNCGCHNHSTCSRGIGICDECTEWSMGVHCELCQPGSFGNATTTGCHECECNGHADEKQGYCDSQTGKCYCKDNTAGTFCHQCKEGYYGDPRNGSKCYLRCEGRSILGSISSGALGTHRGKGVEDKNAYCLWILTVHPDLNNLRLLDVEPTITFTMETDIKTLCSKEYVYVYDGIPSFITGSDTSSGTLLAAFCGYGLEEPVSVEAKSGYLTVYFEANLELLTTTKGFNATYHVNTCPNDCHGNRHCVGNKCVCKDGFVGMDCKLELCPYNCSVELGQGMCDQTVGRCACEQDYGSAGCRDVLGPNAGVYSPEYDPWRMPGHNPLNSSLARMGNTLVSCDDKTLLMFGGYSLSGGYLNDMWQFDTEDLSWSRIEPTNEPPTPRYFHAAVCVPTVHAMYVFGGLVDNGDGGSREQTVNEMWKYNLDAKRWTLIQLSHDTSQSSLPPVAGHTLTLAGETTLYVIGGMSVKQYYNEDTFVVNIATNTWEIMHSEPDTSDTYNNMGAKPTGLYGHTAVYHAYSQSIYVFGGYEYQTDKNIASGNLYALDVKKTTWSLLPPERNNRPPERFFHAAVVNKDYMVVMGGRTRQDYFNNSVMVYRFKCNKWMDVSPDAPRMFGAGFRPVIGNAAVQLSGGAIYVMGGIDSMSHAELITLRLPGDLCTLYNGEAARCQNASGCAACIVHDTNHTYCYDNNGHRPAGCLVENTTVSIKQGMTCNIMRIEGRDCDQHKTCSECLTVWPAHKGHKTVCHWCSNCPTGKCIPEGDDCESVNACKRQQRVIKHGEICVETLCQAASCKTCGDRNSCIWTRQFKRSSEVGRTLSLIAIYDWNCVTKSLLDATQYHIDSSPPDPCPVPCHQHLTCGTCLSAQNHGAEGGDQKCVWSIRLKQCMPPAFLPLKCSNGECGHLLEPPSLDQCPPDCSVHTQCSTTLASPGCGWCAFGGLNGLGVAMEGGLMGPTEGACDQTGVHLDNKPIPASAGNWSQQAVGLPTWAYGSCPPENECLNGHHTCEGSENCTDMLHGYRCDCKIGYSRSPKGGRCVPVCSQGCANQGECMEPEVCSCFFGFVGHNCTTECQCNKHSNCESIEARGTCLNCQNNTQGDHCEYCKPLYVGNSVNGGSCTSCREHCNYHSDVCLSYSQYNLTFQYPSLPKDPENITTWLMHGPRVAEDTLCILCANNTEGDRCQNCRAGFFREALADMTPRNACRPCQCNGHSNVCDKTSGSHCQCQNHTQTPSCDSKGGEKKCWEIQCSLCADNFTGTPVDGHQCYRTMNVDTNYCFDVGDGNCTADLIPLQPGQTVLFHVQPKYLNVDIRIILDITNGGVDLYFSQLDTAFVVDVDEVSGRHMVNIDKRYQTETVTIGSRSRRALKPLPMLNNETANDGGGAVDGNQKMYMIYELHATEFITFITLKHKDTFLIVRNIQHRLVITLPNTIYNLKVSRFFMVLHGTEQSPNGTLGNLVFHQDQPHINLFVFFSVFFSCFFLFLAICVLVWKSKQSVELHRSRHRQRLQMEHMASRPFGRVLALLDPSRTPLIDEAAEMAAAEEATATASGGEGGDHHADDDCKCAPKSRPKPQSLPVKSSRGRNRRHNPASVAALHSPPFSPSAGISSSPGSNIHVAPIALEPTDDGIATVGTVLIQLPGGKSAPMQMSLGSALITMRVYYPTIGRGGGGGGCRGEGGAHYGSKVEAMIHHRGSSTA